MPSDSKAMRFSVLICTCNRHVVLDRALASVIDATEEKPDQVVVVNGGSEDADRVVERYSGRSGILVELVKTRNVNLAVSRNVGMPRVTGDIVAMTDDDAEVTPDWVTQMKRCHAEDPKAGAVGGPVIALDRRPLASRLAEKVTWPSYPARGYVRTLPTVNLSYKAEVIRAVGPQDERMWTGEDVEYNHRMKKLGYEVLYDPAVRVYHNHPRTVRELWHKHFTYGRGYYLLRDTFRDMYCIYPHGIHRWRDVLKCGNFAAVMLYQPVQASLSMERLGDKFAVLPIQFVNQLLWRYGMLVQCRRHRAGLYGR